jgi:hypothetical protein
MSFYGLRGPLPERPDRLIVFGRNYDELTITTIREIITYFGAFPGRSWKKPQYYASLATLEGSLKQYQIGVITTWLIHSEDKHLTA